MSTPPLAARTCCCGRSPAAAPESFFWSAVLVRHGSKHAIMDRRAGTHQHRRRFAFLPAWSAGETGSTPPLLFDTRDDG